MPETELPLPQEAKDNTKNLSDREHVRELHRGVRRVSLTKQMEQYKSQGPETGEPVVENVERIKIETNALAGIFIEEVWNKTRAWIDQHPPGIGTKEWIRKENDEYNTPYLKPGDSEKLAERCKRAMTQGEAIRQLELFYDYAFTTP